MHKLNAMCLFGEFLNFPQAHPEELDIFWHVLQIYPL